MNKIHFEDLSPETIDGVDKVASILEGIEGLELYRCRLYNQEYEYFFDFLICLNGGNKISVRIPLAHLFEIEQESGNVEKDVVIYILDLLVMQLENLKKYCDEMSICGSIWLDDVNALTMAIESLKVDKTYEETEKESEG